MGFASVNFYKAWVTSSIMKKCPVCNSSRYEVVEGDYKCARCGYVNKSAKNFEKDYSED